MKKITKARPHLGQQYEKLLNYKDKSQILRKCNRLKSTSYYINEDINKETLARRKDLWKEVKTHREEGKIAYLNYNTII